MVERANAQKNSKNSLSFDDFDICNLMNRKFLNFRVPHCNDLAKKIIFFFTGKFNEDDEYPEVYFRIYLFKTTRKEKSINKHHHIQCIEFSHL